MKAQRLKIAVIFGTALVLAALVSATAFVLERTWNTAFRAIEASLEHSAKAVENTINRQFLQADSALARIPMLFADKSLETDDKRTPEAASRLLQSLNFQIFTFRDLMIADSNGAIWASARSRPIRWSVPVEEIQAAISSASSSVVGPVRNVMTGDWTLYLVRPMVVPGRGTMYAVAELPLTSFATALSNYADVAGLQILLYRRNGQLLASFPHEELQIGRAQPPRRPEPVRDGVAYSIRGEGGEIAALGVMRPTLYSDVRIELTQDRATAMAEWKSDRDRIIVVCTAGGLFLVVLAIGLLAVLRREERFEAERARAQALLVDAIEAMSDGFVMWDDEDRLITCNNRFRQLYAKSAAAIFPGAHFDDILRFGVENGQYPQAGADTEAFLEDIRSWHRATSGSIERLLPDGRWLMISERRTTNGGIVGIRTDITELKKTLDELAIANARVHETMGELKQQNEALLQRDNALRTQNVLFDAALNNMSQGLLMVGADQRVIVRNRRFTALMGLEDWVDPAPITLGGLFERIGHGARYPRADAANIHRWQSTLGAKGEFGTNIIKSAEGQFLAVVQHPMDNGGFVATYEDVTERQLAEHRIRFLAHHDALTKLPNRVVFRSGLDALLKGLPEQVDGGEAQGVAVLYLDLDKFKNVNDTLGHPVGDALLESVSCRLQQCLRETDLVARLGGDEFAIAIVGADIETRGAALAGRVIRTLSAPYDLAGNTVKIGASIGGAISYARDCSPDTVLKNADLALYEAKAKNPGTYCVFEPEMETRLFARLEIENELRSAVWQDQLEVAYQPLVDLRTNQTIGFEALLRWNHPERGQLSPADFIPVAEETGVIRDLGAWCLRKACKDIATIPGNIKIAVNLSPVQLKSDDLVQTVMSALVESGLSASRLELEITESALLDEDERIVDHLHRLREAGIRIVLDDFGTGYSSLNYLRRFPFNKIKIDKVFINEATTRADCSIIISSIVDLATRLGMSTTAEGIETAEQLDLVRHLGCTEGQGFLLGKPFSILNAIARFKGTTIVQLTPKSRTIRTKRL